MSRNAAAARAAGLIGLAILRPSGGVPVRREQARRRADARAGRRAHGARSRERGRPAHVLPVRPAAHDADAAVHRAGPAGAAIVALPVAARRDRRAASRSSRSRAGWWGSRAPSWRRSRWPLSPLHIQASTTAASEALYLLLWVARARAAARGARRAGALRTFARRRAARVAGRASRATTRGWRCRSPCSRRCVFAGATGARSLPGLAVFSLCAASLPVAWLAWGARVGGDPLFFAHYIMTDHAGLAADVAGRFGPLLGRARQLGIWTLAFVAAMTLPARAGRGDRARRARWRRGIAPAPAMRIVVVAALGPPALYLARGLLLQSFEPLARFALVPGTLLLPLAAAAVPPARERARFASRPPPPRSRSRSPSGWSRRSAAIASGPAPIDGRGDAAGWRRPRAGRAGCARTAAPHAPVMIEPLAFADIGIAHAAGVPWTESITLIVTREPRATRRGQPAGDGRALPRRLRPRGRNRLAAPPARLARSSRSARGTPIRPLARRQSVEGPSSKSLTCKLRVVPRL